MCHIAKAETYPLRKDTDSRQRGSAGESPLVPMGAVPEFESISPPLIEIHGVLLLYIGSKTPLFLGS